MRPEWEDAIREGRQNIDARLVADDIADVKVGSVIRYPGARVRVTHMRFYAGFNDCQPRCERMNLWQSIMLLAARLRWT